ncbi:hypothetical protein [Nocardia sp. NPDC049149]|uniref:hypothetical protein n=1 Tax=Nocardia sp. NPDC049149 TaxID=3364315 RepID=UPI003716F96E
MSENRDRLSVTMPPSIREALRQMHSTSGLSLNYLFGLGVELLYTVWMARRRGGEFAIRLPDSDEYQPVHILIPGLTPGWEVSDGEAV